MDLRDLSRDLDEDYPTCAVIHEVTEMAQPCLDNARRGLCKSTRLLAIHGEVPL